MGKGWFLKILIFALLWIVGGWFFSSFGGSVGGYGSMFYIGNVILGSSLSSDADNVIMLIVSFIITAAAYYLIAEIITFVLMKVFLRGRQR